MTIKGIKTIFPDPTVITVDLFENKRIAVDTSIYLYKYSYGYGPESFLKGFENLLKIWKKSTLIFVFDGKPPELKKKLIEKRKEIENKVVITKEMVEDLKQFLLSKHIEVVQAEHEAEKVCCSIDVDAVLSNDFDCFLFGCKKLIRNIKNRDYHMYELDIILEHLHLTIDQFKELAVACGTDYNLSGIKNYGPKKSLKFLKENTTLKELFDEDCLLALEEINK